MRVLVTIQHSENVHLFRHAVGELAARGHDVAVCAREKGVNLELLAAYGIDHLVLADAADGLVDLAATQAAYERRLLRIARRFDPDVVLSSNGIAGPHVATLLGATSLNFVDTESHVAPQHRLSIPFSDVVYTPAALRSSFGDRQVTYPGVHELASLHPDRFEPNPAVLRRRGLDPDVPFFVVRLNAYDAHHDVGRSGLSRESVRDLIADLSARGEVYVAHERSPADDLPGRDLPVAPHEIHHLLYYADLLVGDSGTMATEAAVLGTPAVRVSPFATERDQGNFRLLEDEYGLLYSFHTSQTDQALAVARALADDDGAADEWADRRASLLDDAIDVTGFVVEQVSKRARDAGGSGPRPARGGGSLARRLVGGRW